MACQWFGDLFLILCGTIIYEYGLVYLAASSPWAELLLVTGAPITVAALGLLRGKPPRTVQLLCIETFFNIGSSAARIGKAADIPLFTRVSAVIFVCFFCVQVGGFVVDSLKAKSPQFVFNTALATLLIIAFARQGGWESTIAERDGNVLLWGTSEPTFVRLGYLVWITNAIFTLALPKPNAIIAIAHLVSVAISMRSTGFFHVRLLTASNLFVIELISLSWISAEGIPFLKLGRVPDLWLPMFEEHIKPVMNLMCTGFMVLLVIAALIGVV